MYVRNRRRRRNRAPNRLLLAILLLLVVAGGTLAYFRLYRLPYRVLARTVQLELGEPLPADAAAYLAGEPAALSRVKVDSSAVDAARTGTYKVRLSDGRRSRTIRLVIQDTTAPRATLVRPTVITVAGRTLSAAELVRDVQDASAVTVSFDPKKEVPTLQLDKLETLDQTLYVRDASGNQLSLPVQIRVVEADQKPPEISGAADTELDLGQTFDPLAGVSASDEIDGDLTQDIRQKGEVDVSRAGLYTLTYAVTDSSGNQATVTRTVRVSDPFSHLRATNVIECTGDAAKPLHAVLQYLDQNIRFMGIVYQDLATGDRFAINPDNQYRSASTAKVFVNMALYDAVDRGICSLDQKITFQSSDFESGTGVLQGMDLKVPYALGTLADYAVIHSDNIAFNMIRRYLGRDATFAYYESVIGHPTNRTSTSMGAGDGAKLMAELYGRDSANFRHMLETMRQTEFNDMLPRYLPQGIVAHKVGFYNSAYHDVGIIFAGERPYILAVFSDGLTNPADVIAEVSRLVYENRQTSD